MPKPKLTAKGKKIILNVDGQEIQIGKISVRKKRKSKLERFKSLAETMSNRDLEKIPDIIEEIQAERYCLKRWREDERTHKKEAD